jgi:hypothetical protein
MIRKIFFLITISVFVLLFQPLRVKAETSINIENLTNKTGLPEGAKNCIAQDLMALSGLELGKDYTDMTDMM